MPALKDIPPFERGPLIDNWQRKQPICDPAELADWMSYRASGGYAKWSWLGYRRGELPVKVKASPAPKSKGGREQVSFG